MPSRHFQATPALACGYSRLPSPVGRLRLVHSSITPHQSWCWSRLWTPFTSSVWNSLARNADVSLGGFQIATAWRETAVSVVYPSAETKPFIFVSQNNVDRDVFEEVKAAEENGTLESILVRRICRPRSSCQWTRLQCCPRWSTPPPPPSPSPSPSNVLVSSVAVFTREWSSSNFSCSLTSHITSHSMKNLAFHSLLRLKDDSCTSSHYLTYTFLLKRLGECTFWAWDWKG